MACVLDALEPQSLFAVEETEVQGESGSVTTPWPSTGPPPSWAAPSPGSPPLLPGGWEVFLVS